MNTNKNRVFKPEKLFAPRNFKCPQIKPNQYLEIGTGKGMHAMQFAQENPDKNLIAIERTRVKFDVFAARTAELELNNLLPVHADAIPWVVHGIPPSSLDGIFLLYPNPEPKNASQRWLNMPFFEFLLSRLKPLSPLVLATNIQEYADEAEEQAKQLWGLNVERVNVPQDSARTHFEVKYLARGETCHQLNMVKPKEYRTHFDDWVAPNNAQP